MVSAGESRLTGEKARIPCGFENVGMSVYLGRQELDVDVQLGLQELSFLLIVR